MFITAPSVAVDPLTVKTLRSVFELSATFRVTTYSALFSPFRDVTVTVKVFSPG